MSKNKLVPKRRFKEFQDTDAWEQHELGEVFGFPVTTNSLSRAQLNYDKGDIRSIHYGDILIKYESILEMKKDEIPFITDGIIEKYKSNLLKNGDIVFADAAEDQTVGKAVEVTGISDEYVVAGLHTIVARPKEKMAKYFSGYYINSDVYHRQLLRLMQGTKVSSISKGNLKKTIVTYPGKLEEQQKNGSFFKQLDDLITLHQRKLEKTKALKSAYLAEMFPAEGERVPKRRFAGFTGEWEEKKIGELGSVAMNKRIFKAQTTAEGDVPFYKIGTFGNKADAFISQELFEEYRAKYLYPEFGDILISASGSIGRTVEYLGKDEYFQDSNIVWLKHDGKLNNSFLKQFYKIVSWEGLEGSTIKRLYNKNILETRINIPSLKEQQKIGQFFNKLDEYLTNQQQKFDKLKAMKQAYLEEMFV